MTVLARPDAIHSSTIAVSISNWMRYFFLTIGIVLSSLLPTWSRGEIELTAMTSLPRSNDNALAFLTHFVEPVNDRGKGIVQIKYLGGPEVTPPRKAGAALKRGVFDILHSPTSYYIGAVPEGYALTLSTKTPAELRANGGLDLLRGVYLSKAGAYLLAWGDSDTRYHIYLASMPRFTANGDIALEGKRMRSTGTYRPFFESLGAIPVGIKATEVYTALQRGVVDGFGWVDSGLVALGLKDIVRYRIDPPFYRANTVVTVNNAKWASLPLEVREFLESVALEYEKNSPAFKAKMRSDEESIMLQNGMQVVTLEGEVASRYIDLANTAVWESLKSRSTEADALRDKFFNDWKPVDYSRQ